ncbi:prepilin-type N-terminal cleavage/methylation domain-containing protein [uncultured Dokdonia sp.]|uniref:PulJ/GspJ family protein n=1 Tax=uncultured Dokdonia sp. TaxID=575653 RepID=UPI002621E47D|nr:prepilin-type N-terminal cleavage/methylation domain-containing protein [uncultured Dokdonia sp.]
MTQKHKIPAFTLSEILVVLAITSIVIAIAFTVLRLVTKQFTTMRARYEEHTEVTKFKQRLLFDFEKGSTALWNEKQQQLAITVQDETIQYEIAPDYVLRDRDTIPFTVQNTRFYYQGDEIEEGVTDGLELTLMISNRPVVFFVSRKVDAQQTIKEVWD